MNSWTTLTRGVSALCACSLMQVALPAEHNADAASRRIEEVVVTAQKREESLQEVPLTISAFDGEFIAQARIEDIKGLIDFTPGLAGRSKDSFIDFISVRGINTNDFGVGGDPSIGIYKDGVYQGRNGTAVTSFYDLERVEVLRGPQGLLFGRNAASGAIHVITARPHGDGIDGYAQIGAGERDTFELEGAINLPLHDAWALRFAGVHSSQDGYVENLAVPGADKLIVSDKLASRASVAYDAKGPMRANISLEYEDRELSASIYRALELELDDRQVASDLGDRDEDDGDILSLTAELTFDLEFATFSSITAFRDHRYTYFEDFDGTARRINHYFQDQDGDYLSEELRLNSLPDAPVQWFAGISWYREHINAFFRQDADENEICNWWTETVEEDEPGSFPGAPLDCPDYYPIDFEEAWPGFDPNGLRESNTVDGDYRGYALYGDITLGLSDVLELSVGARYTYDEKSFSMFIPEPSSALGAFFIFGYFTDSAVARTEDWDDFSPRVALSWSLSDAVNVFGSITKGYKSGGFGSFNLEFPAGVEPEGEAAPDGTRPQAFDPEIVWSYETGVKSELFGGRLRWNANAYVYDYEDLQLNFFDEDLNNTVVVNVGEVDGFGIETDLLAIPGDAWEVYFGAAYSKTDIKAASADVCDACLGNRLSYNPKLTTSAAVTWTHAGSAAGPDFFVTLEHQYQGSIFTDLDNSAEIEVGAYNVYNLRLGLRDRRGEWRVDAYVENATDEFWYDGAHAGEDLIPAAFFGPAPPRTVGIAFTREW